MEPSGHEDSVDSIVDPRYDRWTPANYAATEDQLHPGSTFLHNFKTALLTVEKPQGRRKVLDNMSMPCLQDLTTPGLQYQPSWPLSSFITELHLPSQEEIQVFCSEGFSKFSPYCTSLQSESTAPLEAEQDYFHLALAALGAALQNSSYRVSLWIHANRTLTATLAINNSKLREPKAHTAWFLTETIAVMSSDLLLWRRANISRGFMETAIRKRWKISRNTIALNEPEDQPNISCPVTTDALQMDIVKAMHMGTTPTIAASFGNIPLEATPDSSIAQIQANIFGQEGRTQPLRTEGSDLLKILIILNQVILCSLVLHPLENNSSKSRTASGNILSCTTKEETNRSWNRINRALVDWREQHLASSVPAVQALYHFTQLHLLMPDIQSILTEASYPPRLHQRSARAGDSFESSGCPSLKAIDSAWQLLESVAQCKDNTHVWLPVITFLAALCVWKHIKSQSGSRAHGSVRVLRVFRDELQRMPWPCCKVMMETLTQLTS